MKYSLIEEKTKKTDEIIATDKTHSVYKQQEKEWNRKSRWYISQTFQFSQDIIRKIQLFLLFIVFIFIITDILYPVYKWNKFDKHQASIAMENRMIQLEINLTKLHNQSLHTHVNMKNFLVDCQDLHFASRVRTELLRQAMKELFTDRIHYQLLNHSLNVRKALPSSSFMQLKDSGSTGIKGFENFKQEVNQVAIVEQEMHRTSSDYYNKLLKHFEKEIRLTNTFSNSIKSEKVDIGDTLIMMHSKDQGSAPSSWFYGTLAMLILVLLCFVIPRWNIKLWNEGDNIVMTSDLKTVLMKSSRPRRSSTPAMFLKNISRRITHRFAYARDTEN